MLVRRQAAQNRQVKLGVIARLLGSAQLDRAEACHAGEVGNFVWATVNKDADAFDVPWQAGAYGRHLSCLQSPGRFGGGHKTEALRSYLQSRSGVRLPGQPADLDTG
jgi:hypothetical protein